MYLCANFFKRLMDTKSYSGQFIFYGLLFGMAISSRFLLTFFYGGSIWADIAGWVLLFCMLSALLGWVGKYRETLEEKKVTRKIVRKLVFVVFLTASIFSSIIKYIVFTCISPTRFQILLNSSAQLAAEQMKMLQEQSVQLPAWAETMQAEQWQFTDWGLALTWGIWNLLLGYFAMNIVWSMYKAEQKVDND